MNLKGTVVAFAMMCFAGGVLHGGPILYGLTFGAPNLYTIDPSTAIATLVGSVPLALGSELMAFGGNLYAFDQTNPDTFYQINPATAGVIASHTAGVDVFGEGGAAFRSDGALFMSGSAGGSGTLYQCNVNVNSGCNAGVPLAVSMDGLAFNPSGTLYGIAQSSDSLYTIDPVTGIETLVGGPGVASTDSTGGLAFSANGTLFGAWATNLYTINTGTGQATLIGTTGLGNVGGIAFLDTAVPEPGTFSLLCGGLTILFLRKRARS